MAAAEGPAGRLITAGAVSDADRNLYQWLNGRTAKGVAVISCVHQGRNYAATVTDFLSVSYDPPTMVVSLYSLSRIAEAVLASGRWALSLLQSGQTPVADALSEPGAPLVALLDSVPHQRREASGPALVSGALAWFELATVAVHPTATHQLIIGEVTWLGRPTEPPRGPLVRYESEYRHF